VVTLSDGSEVHIEPDGVHFDCGEYEVSWSFQDVADLAYNCNRARLNYERLAKEAEDAKRWIDIAEVHNIVAAILAWEPKGVLWLESVHQGLPGAYVIEVYMNGELRELNTMGDWVAISHKFPLG
jgi:hypothetical protein